MDKTRYRSRTHLWFPESVTIIKFHWHCQGATLVSARAEVYSVLYNARQWDTDLLLSVEHIEQQYHALPAFHGHEDGLQFG